MFSVPPTWPDGDYVAYLEINTEGDYNGTFNINAYPTPKSSEWDSWAMSYGYPYRGQPSVVYAIPFTLGPAAMFSTMTPVGFGSVDGTDADPSTLHAMDGSITDDPQGAPGSGADRLRLMTATETSRLSLEVRPCSSDAAARRADGSHGRAGRRHRSIRTSGRTCTSSCPRTRPAGSRSTRSGSARWRPIVEGDATSFIQGLPAQAASARRPRR